MQMLTINNVAEALQISKSMARKLIATGQIQAIDLTPESQRRTWRVPPEALERYIQKQMQSTSRYVDQLRVVENG